MEATIQTIAIYKDGCIELKAICKNCNSLNYHNIKHSSKMDKNGTITIDFSQLKKRQCDKCPCDYHLYKN